MTEDDLLENMLDRWEDADLRRQPLSAWTVPVRRRLGNS